MPSESAFTYFEALKGYLETHGCPVALYSDRHSIFRVPRKDAKGGQGMTQFGRALAELNIEILCVSSSQAKGRVERVNRTLQDRLVKELRMAEISDIQGRRMKSAGSRRRSGEEQAPNSLGEAKAGSPIIGVWAWSAFPAPFRSRCRAH